jgi:hypothetical protein
MSDLSKQFRTLDKKNRKHLPATYRLRDGARWHISPEAVAKIEQMRKEEKDAKIAAARLGRSGRGLSS